MCCVCVNSTIGLRWTQRMQGWAVVTRLKDMSDYKIDVCLSGQCLHWLLLLLLLMTMRWAIDLQLGVIFSDRLACRAESLRPKSIRSRGANYIRSAQGTPLTTVPAAGKSEDHPARRRPRGPKHMHPAWAIQAGCCRFPFCAAPMQRDGELKSPSTTAASPVRAPICRQV